MENALGRKAVLERQPPQPGDVPLTCADISKARAVLGYHPRVKIEQGIPLFVEWFKQTPIKTMDNEPISTGHPSMRPWMPGKHSSASAGFRRPALDFRRESLLRE